MSHIVLILSFDSIYPSFTLELPPQFSSFEENAEGIMEQWHLVVHRSILSLYTFFGIEGSQALVYVSVAVQLFRIYMWNKERSEMYDVYPAPKFAGD